MAIRILLSTRLGERRWKQADLARKTGIRPNTINDIYHELCTSIKLEHLDLICEALECDLTDLIRYVPDKIPKINKNRAGKLKNKR